MALSARNQFKGKVVSLKGGSVMTEVVIDIGGGHQIVSLISTSSAKRLRLKKGGTAVAVVKATEVIVSTSEDEWMMARKKGERPRLRGKLWVEIGGEMAMNDAGADLLEQILVCGSVSEAARRLRFNYRRAWMLVDRMNRSWGKALVSKAVGGERGGGTKLTELGEIVLRSYRDLQVRMEHLLDEAGVEFQKVVAKN
jgi:molybdate transport system regulatory protein